MKPKIILENEYANVEAAFVLDKLRQGETPIVTSLDVLDLLLRHPNLPKDIEIVSGEKSLTVEMATRMRFERGFDIRPSK